MGLNFGGPLDFGWVTYGDVVSHDVHFENVPSDGSVTAAITPPNSYFTIAVSVYAVSWEWGENPPGVNKRRPPKDKVYTQVGQSDGTRPLPVSKGQALYVTVELRVPDAHATPGVATLTLTIAGDSWGSPSTVALNATILAVDESTPIGQKWDAMGGLSASGAVLTNAQVTPDGAVLFQNFEKGAIFECGRTGATVWLFEAIYNKYISPSVAEAQTADGQNVRAYLGCPTGDSLTGPGAPEWAFFEQGMIFVNRDPETTLPRSDWAYVTYGEIYRHYLFVGGPWQPYYNGGYLGWPISDVQILPGGSCSYFDSGAIYWKADTGAWEVHGPIQDLYKALGGPSSYLGYPLSDQKPNSPQPPDNYGGYNVFEGGVIHWDGINPPIAQPNSP
jgi:hypothetical protein